MANLEGTVICDNCGVEITWAPLVVENRQYCCNDCYHNLECNCRPVTDWEDDRRKGPRDLDDLPLS